MLVCSNQTIYQKKLILNGNQESYILYRVTTENADKSRIICTLYPDILNLTLVRTILNLRLNYFRKMQD